MQMLRPALRKALVDNGFYPGCTAFELLLDRLVYAAESAVRSEPIDPDPGDDGLCVCGQPLADHRPPDPAPKDYSWVAALAHSGGAP